MRVSCSFSLWALSRSVPNGFSRASRIPSGTSRRSSTAHTRAVTAGGSAKNTIGGFVQAASRAASTPASSVTREVSSGFEQPRAARLGHRLERGRDDVAPLPVGSLRQPRTDHLEVDLVRREERAETGQQQALREIAVRPEDEQRRCVRHEMPPTRRASRSDTSASTLGGITTVAVMAPMGLTAQGVAATPYHSDADD